ncbi:MAG: single-stranded-DNA-specific exonuclease RecJ [Clostridiales Family XIII bacterium]|jgi:single-stranded-DNA-specific exonuclease|nr:single-stranded-DNA-specific exonuclease RecJ [Clostridiales Family XIII bacterium]
MCASAIRDTATIVNQILSRRGVCDTAEFFAEKPQVTHDPFLLSGMDEVVEVVFKHISDGNHICVYGDYDVDGLLSVTLLTGFLECLPGVAKENISWYIPSRFGEGYGLNTGAIEQIQEGGADLIITVDCGIASAAEVANAIDKGMDIVVTDHHEPDPLSAPDCPSIDPKMPNSSYPFDGLCGCGVAFKLAQAIKNKYYSDDKIVQYAVNDSLDLVAVATIADVMSLTDENRTLVKYGLKTLNRGKRWQIGALAEGIDITPGEISAHKIAFGIAPHLNAAGRMGDAAQAVELLKTEDAREAERIIADLISRNTERRKEQEEAVKACEQIIEERYKGDDFLLVKPPRVHEGVSGIVAGKIKEKYGRPAAVLAPVTDGGEALLKGSARSIAGIDIISLMRAHGDLFLRLGGHAMAAGFTIKAENEDALREEIGSEVKALSVENLELLSPPPSADAEILPEEASLELAAALEKFEPTGAGNPKPVLCIKGQTPENLRRLGQDGQHLKFSVGRLECILFAKGDEPAALPAGDGPFDLYGSLGVNRWNGRENAQFIIKGMAC